MILMSEPPLAQFLDHGRGDGDIAVLTALGIFDMESWEWLLAMDVAGGDADGLTDSQAAMIDESQADLEAGIAQGAQEAGDFLAEDDGEGFVFDDADLFED